MRQQKGECLVNENKHLKQNKQGKYREEEKKKKVRTSFTPMPTHVDCSDARKTNSSQKKKRKIYIYTERERSSAEKATIQYRYLSNVQSP